jgi:D-alanyl-lipoteichoic acid acyltransferase DltB (MBOAT superfamily)
MQFPTFTFTLFLLAFLGIWWGVLSEKTTPAVRRAVLCAGSLFFYAWADWRWAGVLVALSTAAWLGSHWIASVKPGPSRRWRGWVSVAGLAGVLIGWKYTPWFVFERNALAEAWGFTPWPLPEWAYPAGLSFFTFHALGLVLSVWHQRTKPLSWGGTLAHVSFFPTLLAGPVLRADATAPRLAQPFRWQEVPWLEGSVRILIGMTFKWVLAAKAAEWAEPTFQGLATGRGDAWWGVHAYAAQIFFDFAGYSYMAIGVALLLGFRLPENFTQPYTATSVQDFWRRWHRSLSFFFRDHLYIDALGGNRHGKTMAMLAAAFTMLVSGLWHGASVLFLIWGAWHAGALVAERLLPGRGRWPAWLGWVVSFEFVVWGWVWFRSDTLDTARSIFAQGWGWSAGDLNQTMWSPGVLGWAALMVVVVATERWWSGAALAWANRTDTPQVSWVQSGTTAIVLSGWAWVLMAAGPVGVPAFIYNGF